jgi:3-dehydroquinate synthase
LLVSNPEIFAHYGQRVLTSLTQAGFEGHVHLIPAGEASKTLTAIAALYDRALECRLERNSTLLALGGGVIGDMTGFAAATWLRGINFIQVPTSLLAMVDASIGGKTGVNHPQGKNLIGAFYQPRLVFIDPQVLSTLPAREFRAGMAEVIKYGVIWEPQLFQELEAQEDLSHLEALQQEFLTSIITRACQAKVDVVSQDEREAGLRAILNYGHTLGHGIESLTGYGPINHGEAVAIGMVGAGLLAVRLGLWTQAEAQRQWQLINKAQLPSRLPDTVAIAALIDSLQSDKKVKAGKVRFILPTAIGKVTLTEAVSAPLLSEVLPTLV